MAERADSVDGVCSRCHKHGPCDVIQAQTEPRVNRHPVSQSQAGLHPVCTHCLSPLLQVHLIGRSDEASVWLTLVNAPLKRQMNKLVWLQLLCFVVCVCASGFHMPQPLLVECLLFGILDPSEAARFHTVRYVLHTPVKEISE